MKRKAIVCDIDGVIFDTSHILKETEDLELYGDLKWDYFYNHCNDYNIKVMPDIIDFWHTMRYNYTDLEWIISTGRNEKCKCETLKKMADVDIFCDKIYMRKNGDLRPASEIKREHLQEIMKNFDIICFIDDDIDNCEMAKSLGVFALRRV